MQFEDLIFTEKYRPKKIENIFLPERIRKIIGDGQIKQDLLFHSGASGSGKTTLAKAIALKHASTLYINVSDESSVDVVREKIKNFGSASVIDDDGEYKKKIIILDEIDGASTQSFKALRGVMESSSFIKNVRIIGTCNYIHNIINAVDSRFLPISFEYSDEEKEEVIKGYKIRVLQICKKHRGEGKEMKISNEALDFFVRKYFPDMRRILKRLQSFFDSGNEEITLEDVSTSNFLFKDLFLDCTKKPNPYENYRKYVNVYYGKSDDVLVSLGKEFIEWIAEEKENLIPAIPEIIKTVSIHQGNRKSVIDEMVNMLACIFTIQEICNKK